MAGIAARVGNEAIVGDNSVARGGQVIPADVVVRRNPARIVSEMSSKDRDAWLLGKAYYMDLTGKHLRLGMRRIA